LVFVLGAAGLLVLSRFLLPDLESLPPLSHFSSALTLLELRSARLVFFWCRSFLHPLDLAAVCLCFEFRLECRLQGFIFRSGIPVRGRLPVSSDLLSFGHRSVIEARFSFRSVALCSSRLAADSRSLARLAGPVWLLQIFTLPVLDLLSLPVLVSYGTGTRLRFAGLIDLHVVARV
jgi:hypothetical protein